MSVSDERKRSTSSATTCSLSFLSIESLTSFGPGKAGPKEMKALDSNRLGWASDPYGTASCLRRQRCCSELRRGLGALLLFRYAACALRVDGNARAHRARKRDRADVTAFRGGGLCPDDLLDDRRVVLQQLTLVEALLPDRQVDIRAPVGAVLELACFRVTDRLADVERHRPRLRVRHLPTRAEDAAEPAKSAPASSASFAFSPSANTATRVSLPVPCGSMSVPRSCCSAWGTLRPRLRCTSTVSSNLTPSEDFRSLTASSGEYTCSRSMAARAWR